jgi:hypothetical protein
VSLLEAAAVTFLLAGTLWWLWMTFCGSHCGFLLTLWQSFALGMIVAAYIVPCCNTGWSWAVLAGLFVAASAVAAKWVSDCKPTNCKAWSELWWVLTISATGVVAGLPSQLASMLPCDQLFLTYVGWIHAIGLASVSSLTSYYCVIRGKKFPGA